MTFNKLTEEALKKAAAEQSDEELREAFRQIAKEEQDIEYAIHAQSEVVLADPW